MESETCHTDHTMNDNIKIILSTNFLSFQALNGFLMILTCEGEVFFATHSIESYLGFHQVRATCQLNLNEAPTSRAFEEM